MCSEVCQKKAMARTCAGEVVYSPGPEGNLRMSCSNVLEALRSGIVIMNHASDWWLLASRLSRLEPCR
jgi:hypothetical protein